MVPPNLVTIHHIPLGVTELVLASDGYLCVLPTLEASEQKLIQLPAIDPLCVVLYAAPRPLLQETLASTTVLIFGSHSDDARSQAAAKVTAAKMLNREPARATS